MTFSALISSLLWLWAFQRGLQYFSQSQTVWSGVAFLTFPQTKRNRFSPPDPQLTFLLTALQMYESVCISWRDVCCRRPITACCSNCFRCEASEVPQTVELLRPGRLPRPAHRHHHISHLQRWICFFTEENPGYLSSCILLEVNKTLVFFLCLSQSSRWSVNCLTSGRRSWRAVTFVRVEDGRWMKPSKLSSSTTVSRPGSCGASCGCCRARSSSCFY